MANRARFGHEPAAPQSRAIRSLFQCTSTQRLSPLHGRRGNTIVALTLPEPMKGSFRFKPTASTIPMRLGVEPALMQPAFSPETADQSIPQDTLAFIIQVLRHSGQQRVYT
eukprot:6531509-Pyramimonas_sp.AAC.1